MIPTPAANLKSDPLRSARRAGAQPLDVQTLYHARRVTALRWSPDGTDIYFETNITGRYNIWRVGADGGWPIQITVSDEWTHLEDPAPDGRWLVYTQDVGGNEKPNIYLLPPTGGPARNVTNTEGVAYHAIQWLPRQGRLLFSAEREAPGAYMVYLLDPQTGDVERVAGNETGECIHLRSSPDGRHLALVRTRDFHHTGVTVLDLRSGEERVLVPIDETTATYAVDWTRDGRGLFIVSNRTPWECDTAGLLDVATGAIRWLTASEWETYVVCVSPVEERYVYYRNEAGTHHVFVRDLGDHEVRIPLPPGVLTHGTARFSPDGGRVALLYESAGSPPEIWVYDLRTDEVRQISQSLVGGLTPDHFVVPQLVTYPSFDGTPIAAFVYLPPNAEPDRTCPGIVYVHGGPAWQHSNGWFPNLQYLVSHGFVVIAPNYRGSTGFGRPFEESNRRDLGGGDLRDVVASADFLRQTGYVDPRRIAVMGGSYGGYMTLMALTKYPEVWAAGVAIVPFANWFTEYQNEDPTLQAYDRMMMGDPEEDTELWRERSPIFFVDRIRAPLLLLAGANDIRCPPEETRQIVEAVREAGGVAEAKIYDDEGHGFARRENQIDAFRRTADFLSKHLGRP
ncbi:MAG: S9 family peptidase [Armatimonadota bacterium]|nr:S9 family peptidase [Armatimonadota bacterium]MDR5696944.1 S9 family peptidase [Armatimonadota bacterium]